jgi:hypothetical protein
MIEHFLKWLKLVPLLDHNSEGIGYAFKNKVFSNFNILVEILSNQSAKFCVEFLEVWEKLLINHYKN